MFVVIQVRVDTIIGHEQIGPAIVVVVHRCHRKIFAIRLINSRRRSHIAESAIAVVVIQDRRAPLVNAGRTVGANVNEIAIARTIGVQRYIPADIEIQFPVAIVIEECGAAMKLRS